MTSKSVDIWLKGVIDDKNQVRPDVLNEKKWQAVPCESGGHFDEEDRSRLVQAMRKQGVRYLDVALLENVGGLGEETRFDATDRGVLALNMIYSHFNCAVIPDNRRFVTICSLDDYFIYAGERSFVEAAVGSSCEVAAEQFRGFARENDDLDCEVPYFSDLFLRQGWKF